ncbi:TonB-dependent receptor, partial [Steroidobacter sp.]|uniref:TonB-dependent receptor n=1 Tax=Steroidobacter sp. TaxID=1978227 RepID=UPI001A535F7B
AGVRDANSFESSGGRIVLLAKPSENLRVRTSVTYEDSDLASEWKVTDVPERLLNTNNFALEPQQDSALVASARVDYTASFGELSAITGYWDRERRDRGLEPNVTFAFLPVTKDFQMNDRGFSQELRFVSEPIGKARVTMAAYYKSSDQEFDALEESAVLSFPGSLLIEKEEYSGKQYSVSSELSYAWTDALTTTVGARYFKENIDTYQLWTEPEIVFTIPRAEFHTELPIEEVLPKVLVEYRATPDLLFYGGATRGARNGNLIYTSILVISDSYGLALPRTSDADSAWSYEIGTKTSWLDNRLTANVALYYIDWQDLQMTASTPPYSVGGGVLSFVYSANVGSARSVGGEIDVAWRPSQYFNVNLSAGYTDAKLGNEVLIDAVSGIRVPKDAMIPFTPEYKGAVTIAGRYPLGTALTATTNIGVQHIGPQASRLRQIPDDPVQPYEKYPAYTIVDVRAGVEWNDWTVTAFMRNATDKIVGVTGAAGFNYRVNTPRTIGLMVSTSF